MSSFPLVTHETALVSAMWPEPMADEPQADPSPSGHSVFPNEPFHRTDKMGSNVPHRHVSQPTSMSPSPMQLARMRDQPRLSSSAADILDMPTAGSSNAERMSGAQSFRSFERCNSAAATASPADMYRPVYATSPLAPRAAIRSPSRTPPATSPNLARLAPNGFRRPSAISEDSSLAFSRRPSQQLASPSSIKSRRRFSEQRPSSVAQAFSPGSQATNYGTLIGSYEESLLSGRMSTVPSKPLTFDAELGVLGHGKCKASLRCPPHVNVKFPAHFYNLEDTSSDREGKASPSSPYVGTIDLDSHYTEQLLAENLYDMSLEDSHPPGTRGPPVSKTYSRPSFPGYRVPPKGQVQLIIKNPHLTAVKVFLVPYDLTDMPAGTKTFVRQKCHLSRPAAAAAAKAPASAPFQADEERAPSNGDSTIKASPWCEGSGPVPPASGGSPHLSHPRETLRYAVHLQFCAVPAPEAKQSTAHKHQAGCEGLDRLGAHPARPQNAERGNRPNLAPRIYLHKAIRVVFSARVPDNSEKVLVTNESPRASEAKGGHNLFSTYAGPGEDWNEARRAYKSRAASRKEMEERHALDALSAFDVGIANSDPNGERLDASSGSAARQAALSDTITPANRHRPGWNGEEETVDMEANASEALDILPSGHSDWARRHPASPWIHAPPPPPTTAAAPSAAHAVALAEAHSSVPNGEGAQVDAQDGPARSSSRPRSRTLQSATAAAVARQGTTRTAVSPIPAEHYDDRALLEQWHASLALRSQQAPGLGSIPARPGSPSSVRSRPTSPPHYMSSRNGHGTNFANYGHGSLAMIRTTSNGSLPGAPLSRRIASNGRAVAAAPPTNARPSGQDGANPSQSQGPSQGQCQSPIAAFPAIQPRLSEARIASNHANGEMRLQQGHNANGEEEDFAGMDGDDDDDDDDDDRCRPLQRPSMPRRASSLLSQASQQKSA